MWLYWLSIIFNIIAAAGISVILVIFFWKIRKIIDQAFRASDDRVKILIRRIELLETSGQAHEAE